MSTRAQHAAPPPLPVPVSATACNAWLCPPGTLAARPQRPAPLLASATQRDAQQRLSLSRLNHWLPWAQTHPEVVQGTTEFHDEIADAVLPEADAVFDN